MCRALVLLITLSLGGNAGCLRTSERIGAATGGDSAADGSEDSARDAAQLTENGVNPVDGTPEDDGPIASVDARADAAADATDDAKRPRDIGPAPDKPPPLDGLAVTSACSTSATQSTPYPSPNMRICTSMISADQCTADKFCNAVGGWKLCTPSQYRSRGGETTPSNTVAWIGACIRSGGATTAPSAGPCIPCVTTIGQQRDVAWPCASGSVVQTSDALALGVAASSSCRNLGINDAQFGAFWAPLRAAQPLNAAVCCK